MSRYFRRVHDPDISDAEFGEIHDAWQDAQPDPADYADEAGGHMQPIRGPLTDALDERCRLRRYAEAREAAEAARRDGDHAGARWWDAEAERWAR